jgi:LmeA-like phospholipid-binding
VRVLLVLVLVLAALLTVVDRVGVAIAERRVGQGIAEAADLASPPEVDVVGFPVLDEAVRGSYDEVRIDFTADDLGQPAGTRAEVVLRGAQVPLRDLFGVVREVPVERLDGTATLSYALLSEEIGPDTELSRDGDGLRITRTVDVAGEQVPLVASGDVTLEGTELVIDVRSASGAGIEVPDAVVEQAGELLSLRYQVPELPYGLDLVDVRPERDGVVVVARGEGTVIPTAPA